MSPSQFQPGDANRTVVRPMPGGRPLPPQQSSPPGSAGYPGQRRSGVRPPDQPEDNIPVALPSAAGNPILAAASPLLSIAPRIRHSATHPDARRLKDELTQSVRRFEQQVEEAGVPHSQVIASRYVMCTFLDECAASTPWGGSGVWASDTLLVRLHNETWGGEKVFQLLTRLAQEPKAHIDLLELIYVCLSLGFEGRYRIAENGRSQLETVRERLFKMIKEERQGVEKSLSLRWRPAVTESRRWFDMTPLWVMFALCLALVTGTYLLYRMLLNSYSNPVFAMLQDIRPAPLLATVGTMAAPKPDASAVLPARQPELQRARLRGFLEPEIAAGLVAVDESAEKSVITLRGDGIFEPGSAQVNASVQALLGRIAAELRAHPGMVVVSGHTDSQPIRSLRFPSNFHLSQERADGVAKAIAASIGKARVRAEGKAESEPVAPNDTPAGRARNRRVTITLLADQVAQATQAPQAAQGVQVPQAPQAPQGARP
jgi:type VI secretion system protein ImpK